jgi:hypothetical protein
VTPSGAREMRIFVASVRLNVRESYCCIELLRATARTQMEHFVGNILATSWRRDNFVGKFWVRHFLGRQQRANIYS